MLKKNLYKLFILLVLDNLFNNIHGQNDFKEGYIITNENDTIHGLVDLKSNLQNSRVCRFKKSDKAETVEYLPGQIKGYSIPGSKFYVSKDITQYYVTQTVFLEFLVEGVVNLYYYKKDLNYDYFYLEKDNSFIFTWKKTILCTSYQMKKGRYLSRGTNTC